MPLFSKKRETVDELVNRLVTAREADDLESELRKFDPSRLSGTEKETWHLHWGIAAFRRRAVSSRHALGGIAGGTGAVGESLGTNGGGATGDGRLAS